VAIDGIGSAAPPTAALPGALPLDATNTARELSQRLPVDGIGSNAVAVGKAGKTWTGVAHIQGKFLKPAWSPPEEIRRDKPNLPDVIPGGTPENPMGVAAMTLNPGEYAIHGTNAPNSIGHFASYGCIRMHNSDIMDLYQRVDVGTPVVVLR